MYRDQRFIPFGFGVPFVGGLLGGLIGSAIARPPYGFYQQPCCPPPPFPGYPPYPPYFGPF